MHELWSHEVAAGLKSPELWTSSPDTLFIASATVDRERSVVTALDLADGGVRWTYTTEYGTATTQPMAVDGDLLVVLIRSGAQSRAIGLDTATGAERWSRALSGEPRGVHVDSSGVVLVAGSTIHAWGRDGTPRAKQTLRGTQLVTLTPTGDGAFVLHGATGKKNVLRVTRDGLDVQWTAAIPGENWMYHHPSLVTPDMVVFHSYSHWAMALDVEKGAVRWRRKKAAGRGGVVLPGPDGTIVMGTSSLSLHAPTDGKPRWTVPDFVAAASSRDGSVLAVARRASGPYKYAPEEPLELRIEFLDPTTGEPLDGVDVADARCTFPAGDTAREIFALIPSAGGNLVISGLDQGWVRALSGGNS